MAGATTTVAGATTTVAGATTTVAGATTTVAGAVASTEAGAVASTEAGAVASTEAGTSPVTPNQITVASALTNPRGFTWNPDTGALVVALAGSGGTNPPTENTPTNAPPLGPFSGGLTAAVASISADGCPAARVQGLPSAILATGEVLGADDVAYIGR